MEVLCTLKVLGKFKIFSRRKWGSNFSGAWHIGGVSYMRTLYITFYRDLWAVKSDVEILSNSTSGLELQDSEMEQV